MIPAEKWKWFGHAQHFIAANRCLFHLATQVGDVMVSTVGDFRPELRFGENGPQDLIGHGRTFESMVFAVDGACIDPDCDCCGAPTVDFSRSLGFHGYTDRASAIAGHREMCAKWAELDGIVPPSESEES